MKSVSINLNNKCNLRCQYCFVNKLGGEMSIACLQAVEAFLQTAQVEEISFFGTEPLMSRKLLISAIEQLSDRKLSITTNGTLIDDELSRFFSKYNVSLLVSCDGDKVTHEMYRSHWEDTVRGIRLLNRHKISPFILVSVTPETLPYLAYNLEWLHTNFDISGTAGNIVTTHHPTKFRPRVLRKYLTEYYQKVLDMDVREFYWEKVQKYIKDPELFMERRTCGACHGSVGINYDGKIYPCHKVFTDPIGDVFSGIDNEKMGKWSSFDYRECHFCPVRFCAPCYEENFVLTEDPCNVSHYTCLVETVRWEVVNKVYKENFG